MIQIRHKIFETNSSTTHCLVIMKTPKINELIAKHKARYGNKIVFGVNKYDDIKPILYKNVIIDESTDFQTKADVLYLSMYLWTEGSVIDFLEKRRDLTEALTKLGFDVEYREDLQLQYENAKYDLENNMFENMNADEAINFLFNHSLYYEWNDECCSEIPSSVDNAICRFTEFKNKLNEEEVIYSYR